VGKKLCNIGTGETRCGTAIKAVGLAVAGRLGLKEDYRRDLVAVHQRDQEGVFRPGPREECRLVQAEACPLDPGVAYQLVLKVVSRPDRVVAFQLVRAVAFRQGREVACQRDRLRT
jgi:hypothetical protein